MFLFTPSMLLGLSDTELERMFRTAHYALFFSEQGSLQRSKALAELENIIHAMNLKRLRKARVVGQHG